MRNWEEVDASIAILGEVSDQILTPITGARDEEVLRVGDEVEACHSNSGFQVSGRHFVFRLDGEVSQE